MLHTRTSHLWKVSYAIILLGWRYMSQFLIIPITFGQIITKKIPFNSVSNNLLKYLQAQALSLKSIMCYVKFHSYFTATQLLYQYIDHLSTTSQRNTQHLNLKWMKYYCNAVLVRAAMEIPTLQLTATLMQWSMNKALVMSLCR